MRSLRESLGEYGEVMLGAIAGQWQVEVGDGVDLPARLAAAMLDPERLQAFVGALDAGARAALEQVTSAGGSIRGYLLTRVHGEVRRLGPKAIVREAPWRHPASATERLWYAGLLFRRYGRLGAYHGELYYIPPDLLGLLPARAAPAAALAIAPIPEPERTSEQADALALDLEALLARLRLSPGVAPSRAGLAATLLSPLSERWRGPADPERLALLERLAAQARLVARRGDRWQVSAQARAWLQLGPYRRTAALFEAWRSDAHWNELWRVPSLRCEGTGWRNDPLLPRAGVLGALGQCPAGWVRLADLVAAIKATQPDLARPDGDYDSWYIRDAATGQYLQGYAHWDSVEGALVAHLVTRSLYWLGVVALGGAEGGAYDALRLTATGRALLGLEPPPAEPSPAPFTVHEDLTILVPRRASAYDRVRLERFARWQGREGEDDLYRVEPESAWQAFNGGLGERQLVGFLARASGRSLPAEAARTLRAWGASFGQVRLQRAILLQTANAETLRRLRADPELKQRLGISVSERAVLVPEGELAAVLARLKQLGLWPHLLGLAEP